MRLARGLRGELELDRAAALGLGALGGGAGLLPGAACGRGGLGGEWLAGLPAGRGRGPPRGGAGTAVGGEAGAVGAGGG
ncbi:MAG: hypothetical protein ACKOJI_08490, partial [Phycisphaerales bacterium]